VFKHFDLFCYNPITVLPHERGLRSDGVVRLQCFNRKDPRFSLLRKHWKKHIL